MKMTTDGKFFHGENHQIWDYCIYLGPYTDEHHNYDLGVYAEAGQGRKGRQGYVSLAAVYGPEDSQYRSGELAGYVGTDREILENCNSKIRREALRRYREYLKNQESNQ